jgi:hypothetical protein
MWMDTDGRRMAKRFVKRIDVELMGRDRSELLRTADVSRHGLFLSMEEPPPENHVVLLTVHIPGGPFETMATVARRSDMKAKAGAGVKFYCLASDAKDKWDSFIATLEGKEFTLEPRPSTSADSVSFIVHLDSAEEIEAFFNRHVRPGRIVHVTPAVKKPGAEMLLVLVHPETLEEFVLPATVEEYDPEKPLRMGVRFAELNMERVKAFRRFLGIDKRGEKPVEEPDADEAVARAKMRSARRSGWNEYAFFSPRVAPDSTTDEPEADLEVVKGEPVELTEEDILQLPELELMDRKALFDFNWGKDES